MSTDELEYLTPEARARVVIDRMLDDAGWVVQHLARSTSRVYDLRTNKRFTLKQNPLRAEHLADFVSCYAAPDRRARAESERFRRFAYEELVARDKASLDLTWLRDESLEDTDNLPAPEAIAQEIVDDLEAALAEFSAVAESLARG